MGDNPLVFIDPNGTEWFRITEEYEEEEEYTDENGEAKTRTVTKTREVWRWFKDTPEMEVWTGEYDANGNRAMETVQGKDEIWLRDGPVEFYLTIDRQIIIPDIKIGMMPLGPPGGFLSRFIGAKGMTNSWNYFQHLQKVGKIPKSVAYDAWKASGGLQKWASTSKIWRSAGKVINMPQSFTLGLDAAPPPSGALNKVVGLFIGKVWNP